MLVKKTKWTSNDSDQSTGQIQTDENDNNHAYILYVKCMLACILW